MNKIYLTSELLIALRKESQGHESDILAQYCVTETLTAHLQFISEQHEMLFRVKYGHIL